MPREELRRHRGFKMLSRDHGLELVCAQQGRKAVSASSTDRLRLAGQIRAIGRDVILSYLEDEHRLLSPLISSHAVRMAFEERHENVRALVNELDRLDASVDPGLGLLSRISDALDEYVRWEEHALFPVLEAGLDESQLETLFEVTRGMEVNRLRPSPRLLSTIAQR